MAEKSKKKNRISMSNTKQEMLDLYGDLVAQLEEKNKVELKPEEKIVQRNNTEVVKVADAISSDGVLKGISNLRIEMGNTFNQLAEKLEEEVNKYKKIKDAIVLKDNEFQEIYEIQRQSQSLLALIEAQSLRREEFETEMEEKKDKLEQEIEILAKRKDSEQKLYEAVLKERTAEDKKNREREKEEYEYAFKREQELARYQFEDEKSKLEKEIQDKKELVEKELFEREKRINEKESELEELRKFRDNYPKQTETVLAKANKEITDKLQLDSSNREEFLKKTFEGESNVLVSKIDSLEKLTGEQKEHINKLSLQLEKAYQKVQDIAIKTVEGSDLKSYLNSQQQWIGEQGKKQL